MSSVDRYARPVEKVGPWGPRIRQAYENLGVVGFADVDAAELQANDDRVTADFDARRPGAARPAH